MVRELACCVSVAILLAALPAAAGTLRIATYNVDLSRDGPGVLLHDLGREPDPGLDAVLWVIRTVRPDVLLITQFDHDLRGRALAVFRGLLAEGPQGIDYPYAFLAPVNAGMPSGRDLDGDGLGMGPGDALGWGKFPGDGGMALLSRLPVDEAAARTFRDFRWADLPEAMLPERPDGGPWPDAEGRAALRLSSRSHWDVPVELPGGGRLRLLAANPTPPLFDGPEGLNRRRNRDEIGFWMRYIDGQVYRDDQGRDSGASDAPFVLLGDLNLDPVDGEGLHDTVARLLAHAGLQDPAPASAGAVAGATAQGGVNATHAGPPALDTADWRDDGGPGNLRVDYALPSADLEIAGSGVFWPAPGEPLAEAVATGPAHRLVWVDLALP
jgi:hypothetical protein